MAMRSGVGTAGRRAGGAIRADGPPQEVMTSELLSDVYECRIETMPHPRTGALVVLPWRD